MDKDIMRNAFIRVSSINNTKKGVVEYSLKDIKNIVDDWAKRKSMSYYIIEHNCEGENKHYHIVLDFDNHASFKIIKKNSNMGI